MIKKIFFICGVLALTLSLAVVPCFAIQSGWYDGQPMIHLLGAQYQVELSGIDRDALVLFDTRGMYWYEDEYSLPIFDSISTSLSAPDCYYHNELTADEENSQIYNDLVFTLDSSYFPSDNTSTWVYMVSDRFAFGSDARLGLHLSPVYNAYDNMYLIPSGELVSATVHFYALTVDGDVIDVPFYREDLVVGGTYDLTARFQEFFEYDDIQYYWISYEGGGVVPTFVQDFSIRATMPWTDVRVVDWATDIVYPEVISYEDFNLLSWLGTSIDGFLTTTIFSVGGIDVTLGVIVSIPLTIMILIVFLKKFAGG